MKARSFLLRSYLEGFNVYDIGGALLTFATEGEREALTIALAMYESPIMLEQVGRRVVIVARRDED